MLLVWVFGSTVLVHTAELTITQPKSLSSPSDLQFCSEKVIGHMYAVASWVLDHTKPTFVSSCYDCGVATAVCPTWSPSLLHQGAPSQGTVL
mmetsp:Transcript_33915/g.56664  ORF Transcript_33915/g.56664 Transcript_33915/m.56664 type:complete len:92 (+) Transcript_33915:3007-3282(+)